MKVTIRLKKDPIEIDLSEDLPNENVLDFFEKILSLIDSKSDIIFDILDDNYEEAEDEYEIEKPINIPSDELIAAQKKGININLMKLSKDSDIPIEDIKLIFDLDYNDDPPFPLISPINDEKARTKNQRKAILLFLYQNYVLSDNKSLNSRELKTLLEKSKMDSSELSKAFKTDSSGWVKQDGQKYRITSPGLIKARDYLKKLTEAKKNRHLQKSV